MKQLVYKFKSLAVQQPDPVVDNSGFGFNNFSSQPNVNINTQHNTGQQFEDPFASFHNMSHSEVLTDSAYQMQRTEKVGTSNLPNLRGNRTGHESTNPQQFAFGSDIMNAYGYPPEESKTTTVSTAGKNKPDRSDEEKRPRIDSQDIRADQEVVYNLWKNVVKVVQETFSDIMAVKVSEVTQLTNAKNSEVQVLGYFLNCEEGKYLCYKV